MTAGAPERNLRSQAGRDTLRHAGRRLKEVQERYDRFVSVAPRKNEDVIPNVFKDVKAAQDELQAARHEFLDLYADFLRNDPAFAEQSAAAERRLAKGPPWEGLISLSELINESDSTDR
jgi:hypothetical protein